MNERVLWTPIIDATAEAQALEAVRIATLAEHMRLEELQKSLEDRARRQPSSSNRRQRQLFLSGSQNEYQVLHTLIQNLAATARIADSIHPSRFKAR